MNNKTPPNIIKTNLLTKFHENPAINVAATALTRQIFMTHNGRQTIDKRHTITVHSINSHVFTIYYGGHVFSPIWTIIELFHNDWVKIVTSRVNTAPPPGGHLHKDWASNVTSTVFTSFELSRGINGTNVLTKFHEDQTINVDSRVFTRQMLTPHDGQRTKGDHISSP
ncbi:hypothetical protein DPMN_086912 [Dreissena polymorpha]|uniref:Uncharacterized protein n=1 Tax=Dreissena polymorpha TaxID=45954 RepID=A0A9D4KS13_DREPO|nr:hypothetical protein DPMN_086912 [Dreissena polymorpha]